MLTLEQALWHGKKKGVKFFVINQHGRILGASSTLEGARKMMQEFNRERWAGIAHIEKKGE